MHVIPRLLLCSALLAFCAGAARGQSGNGRAVLPSHFFLRASLRAATAKSPDAGRVLCHFQDAGNHYALAVDAKAARLVRVVAGKETVLAGPVAVAIRPEAATPVLIKRLGERIECFVGSAAPLRGEDATFTGGRAAMVVGSVVPSDLRVQPIGPVSFSDDFMRGEGEPGPWAALAGTWAIDRVPNPTWSANAFRYLGKGDGVSLAAAGQWFWHDYAARVAAQPGEGAGAVGLAVYVEDAQNYLVFRCASAGAAELVRVQAGRETVVARAAGALDPRQWYELAVAVRGTQVAAFIDGQRVLAAKIEGLTCGRVGLYCRDAAGVRFDDVAAASAEAVTADAIPRPNGRVTSRFRSDRYMQGWASELGSWLPEGGSRSARAWWHIGFFPGDFTLAWTDDEPLAFEQGPLEVVVAPEDRDAAKGYRIALTRDRQSGRLTAQVERQGAAAATWHADIPASQAIKALSLRRRGSRMEASVDGRPLGAWTDEQPLAVRRLGVRCAWLQRRTLYSHYEGGSRSYRLRLPAVQFFAAACPQLRDDAFHHAPVDWRADAGTWEVTSRWICLPHFTWLGGRSHEAAILWHKHRFGGDVILDVHAAVMMNYGPLSGYDRYGDLNLTICADGRDLSSGYTVQFGARGNSVTRILRRDKIVAETDQVLYPSRDQGAHQSWLHVRVERRGPRVLLFIANRLVADFTDPAPLDGKHLAVWTWNRGLMVARARIWADRDEGIAAPLAPAPTPPAPDRPRLAISSPTHPSDYYGFDRGLDGWRCPTGEHGGRLHWESRDGGGCLRIENPTTGGDFAVAPPLDTFDATRLQLLAFDYRLPAGVRINLYLKALGRWHVVGLTGPTAARFHTVTESRAVSGRTMSTSGLQLEGRPPVVLGRIPVVADGAWHRATFDLLAALRAAYPGRDSLPVEALHFANWSNEGYLQCGFGGNRRGARYWLDDVLLGRYGPDSGRLAWQLDGGTPCAWAIDRLPTTAPDTQKAGADRAAVFEGLGSGDWYLHVAAPANGALSLVRHHRFLVDRLPPMVRAASPAPGSRAAPTAVKLTVADPGGSGVDPWSLRLAVNSRTLAGEQVAMTRDGNTYAIAADLRGTELDDGQRVVCTLSAADRAGNRKSLPYLWAWTFDRSQDKAPPTRPVLTLPAPSAWDEDFERPSDEWRRFPGSAWVDLALDDSTAAAGRRCLRIEGGPGPFRCVLRRRPFDVRARPILRLHYQADARARWDLAVETDLGWRTVAVNGGTRHWPVIATFRSYQPDGAWHHVDIPLGSSLATTKSYTTPVVRTVALIASRLSGSQTTALRLDAMQLLPAVFGGDRLRMAWAAHDPSGIRGYSFALDQSPTATPDATLDPQTSLATALTGPAWFHCRALDRAGNWGPTLHQRLVITRTADTQPPKVVELSPPLDARVAADAIRVRLADEGTGLCAESVRLTVAGKLYTIESPELRVHTAQGLIEWTPLRHSKPAAPAFANGATVACRLEAADYAGNPLPQPVAWSWTVDFAQDKAPPPAPYVTWLPDGALAVQDFERGPGHWMGRREGWAEVTDETAATGVRSIRFGGFSTFMHYAPFDAERFPIVGFDYRLDPGAQLTLMARFENRNWCIRFNSPSVKYPAIGTVAGVVADGQWHSCRFNLAAMMRAMPEADRPRTLVVDHLATLTYRVPRADQRAAYHVDNFHIAPRPTGAVRVHWSVPADPTGIAGYSLLLDRAPATMPDGTIDARAPTARFTDLAPGAHYLHVRARDGAGNWGPPAHARIDIAAPAR